MILISKKFVMCLYQKSAEAKTSIVIKQIDKFN
ncbi:unknown protein [Parachlamydia acanthamoebae UV-7]|uniref:Uncharacterized protein n=1 Tax=Parachlamydia acanthamoebae (strain UV7) TaxID=765952 RepID=F8KYV9_PARAV|nr:unknown protein [Parachlamydia acanthamoebae UV-7]